MTSTASNQDQVTTIRQRNSTVRLRLDGILEVEMDAGAEINLADADASVQAQAALSAGVKRPVLIKMGQMKSIERDARNRVTSAPTAEVVVAAALLISSPITRVIGNFMMGFNKGLYPTRMFTSEAEAVVWLREFAEPSRSSQG